MFVTREDSPGDPPPRSIPKILARATAASKRELELDADITWTGMRRGSDCHQPRATSALSRDTRLMVCVWSLSGT
jgi:hypothetical protein